MPRRELKSGKQVADWIQEVGAQLQSSGNMTLIGSAALLWHAHDRGLTHEPEVRHILESSKGSDHQLDTELRQRNLSLRAVVKEIPSVFGSFFE